MEESTRLVAPGCKIHRLNYQRPHLKTWRELERGEKNLNSKVIFIYNININFKKIRRIERIHPSFRVTWKTFFPNFELGPGPPGKWFLGDPMGEVCLAHACRQAWKLISSSSRWPHSFAQAVAKMAWDIGMLASQSWNPTWKDWLEATIIVGHRWDRKKTIRRTNWYGMVQFSTTLHCKWWYFKLESHYSNYRNYPTLELLEADPWLGKILPHSLGFKIVGPSTSPQLPFLSGCFTVENFLVGLSSQGRFLWSRSWCSFQEATSLTYSWPLVSQIRFLRKAEFWSLKKQNELLRNQRGKKEKARFFLGDRSPRFRSAPMTQLETKKPKVTSTTPVM